MPGPGDAQGVKEDHCLQSIQMMARCKQQYLDREDSFTQSVNVYQGPERCPPCGMDKLCTAGMITEELLIWVGEITGKKGGW